MKLCFLAPLAFLALTPSSLKGQKVFEAKIDGSINPATADYIHRAILQTKEAGGECLILHLNTPGGLLKSTRVIVSDFLSSDIPIVVYVSPPGSQAASAGVFITIAGHLAVMAPGTNIGAAHPVSLEGQQDTVMMEKSTNDAAAFIRTIAEKRKRNIAWAEEAVRKSISITETEALKKNVVDLIAKNTAELLEQLDGKTVKVSSRTVTLQTKGATIEPIDMGWSEHILDILSDPNIAYILFMLGVYGLLFELYNPGAILPGVVGVISLILAFYSLHTLPVNYAGLALILFAVILFIAEIKVTSYGLLTVGGVISLFLGSMMLIRSDSSLEFIQISWSVIITSVVVSALFFLVVLGVGLRAQRAKPTTGIEGMIGETGETLSKLDPFGTIRIHGELWNAETASGPITKGEKVRVLAVNHLTLRVERSTSG